VNRVHELIQELRKRPDVGVADEQNSWRIVITKGRDLFIEVIVPHDVLEWHACIKHRREKKEIWSDWMDYSGYDDSPKNKLEAEMARDILAYIDNVSMWELKPPYRIHV
jgi:hypothetical protein